MDLDRVLHRGRDITDNPLDLVQDDSYIDVRIILTDQTSRLTGLITDTAGNPVTDRAVVALSVTPAVATSSSSILTSTGGMTWLACRGAGISSLPSRTSTPVNSTSASYFEAIAAIGIEATIVPGETTTLDLTVSEDAGGLAN